MSVNKHKAICYTGNYASQSGAVLITGLVFLVVLTMLGITTARQSTLENRMSSNTQDRLLALQAADLALRDAESDIYGSGTAPRNLEAGRIPGVVSTGLSHFSFDCDEDGVAGSADDGLCYNGPAGYPAPIWTTANIMNAAPSVAYGTFTGAVPIVGLSAQPRYLIEGFRKQSPGSYGPVLYYRITARAQGANPNTVVWLQEIFR